MLYVHNSSYTGLKRCSSYPGAAYIIQFSLLGFETIVNIRKTKRNLFYFPQHVHCSSVSLAVCPNVNRKQLTRFLKQKHPDLRRIRINNSYFKLNVFIEHKIFTKHFLLLRLLFLNTFPYSGIYYF